MQFVEHVFGILLRCKSLHTINKITLIYRFIPEIVEKWDCPIDNAMFVVLNILHIENMLMSIFRGYFMC